MLLSCGKPGEVSNKNPGSKNNGTNETYKIGITQIATHPSLDLVKQGFKKAFEDAGIKAEFDEKNAEGTIANATLIANGYKSDKKNLVLGIGTPSAQALVNTITDMPVLFSAVTDPESAKLLNKNFEVSFLTVGENCLKIENQESCTKAVKKSFTASSS